MPRVALVAESAIIRTPRVMQLEGIFDIPPTERSGLRLDADLPLDEKLWSVGLIVGHSGSGKSSVARAVFGDVLATQSAYGWPTDRSVLDGFPAAMGIKEIVGLLSSVGFSSPPSWVRPFHVLSTGEQFRVSMARLLAESPGLVVVDEFTSVVDRTVAQIGSHAIAKAVRARKQQFVAVTCHEDVEAWLDPDWVYRPATNAFLWRALQRRPPITITVRRCHRSLWTLFRHHHYLNSAAVHRSAQCLVAVLSGRPVAFAAIMPNVGVTGLRRISRLVVLPDFQGVGIGMLLCHTVGAMLRGVRLRVAITTGHPAMIATLRRSSAWKMTSVPRMTARPAGLPHLRRTTASNRLVGSFEFVGDSMPVDQARTIWTDSQFNMSSDGP